MNYTEKFFELKNINILGGTRTTIDESIDIATLPFNSENHWERLFDENKNTQEEMLSLGMPDSFFFDNNHFTYPVFLPKSKGKFDKAIILLHGLNERLWDKYLPWAYYLALHTNRPVILFPMSFHMNRAPLDWVNPKIMGPLADKRREKFKTNNLTFANLALSSRLTEDPLRFMRSGHQSAEDLILLSSQIEQGLIPFFNKGTKPDFFAYSIGAFVSQILLLANPNEIFTGSRFFLFCGGAFFKDMCGVSKLIMDQVAYETINAYYTTSIDKSMHEMKTLGAFLNDHKLGKAFYTMLKEDNNRLFREEQFAKFSPDIYAVSLKKDKVIPATGIDTALKLGKSSASFVQTLDFPYDYCHENPFPVTGKADKHIVDFWFSEVMNTAVKFLN